MIFQHGNGNLVPQNCFWKIEGAGENSRLPVGTSETKSTGNDIFDDPFPVRRNSGSLGGEVQHLGEIVDSCQIVAFRGTVIGECRPRLAVFCT